MSANARLEGARIVICAGAGGVGKTTTSAAIALGLAGAGKRVAVVTIDPAERLADALGIDALGGEPHRVDPTRFEAAGLQISGELWAMTLDSKATFDDLVVKLAPDETTRAEILRNPIYRRMSAAASGSHEFTAIAKLYELSDSGRFDVIVLDTPPSRNALDFLDAPDRLTGFLEGRGLGALLAPTGFAARIAGRGSGLVLGTVGRLTGGGLLTDIQTFFGSFAAVLDGFRERSAAVAALLEDPSTAFLVVTSPEAEPATEAIYSTDKLREAKMPFCALIVNKVTPAPADGLAAPDVDALTGELSGDLRLAKKVARSVLDQRAIGTHDATQIQRLAQATGDGDPILVPRLSRDVRGADELVTICEWLFKDAAERTKALHALGV